MAVDEEVFVTKLTYFPSFEDRDRLLQLRKEIGIHAMDPYDRAHLHAYDYAWRRVVLNEREPSSPIDPDGKYANPTMVASAVRMWRAKLNKPEPAARTADPSPDDIAYVEVACNQIRANLASWAKRNAQAFNGTRRPSWTPGYDDLGFVADEPGNGAQSPGRRFVVDTVDLVALQNKLGIVVTPETDTEAGRQAALRNMTADGESTELLE